MDEKLKKRLAGAAVVLLLGFALVSLLPGPGSRSTSENQLVTIALQADEASTLPQAPPSDQTTPSTLQAEPQSPPDSAGNPLSPAEMEAASGGEVDLPPEAALKPSPAAAPRPVAPKSEPAPAKPAAAPAPAKPDTAAAGKPAASPAPANPPANKPTAPAKAAAESKPAQDKPAASKPAAPASAPPPSAPVAAKPAAAPTAGNWFVQLGGYADIANARQVQAQVQGKGLSCIIAPVDTNKGTIYRVRAGPFKDRAQAQAAQTRLGAAGFAAATLVSP